MNLTGLYDSEKYNSSRSYSWSKRGRDSAMIRESVLGAFYTDVTEFAIPENAVFDPADFRVSDSGPAEPVRIANADHFHNVFNGAGVSTISASGNSHYDSGDGDVAVLTAPGLSVGSNGNITFHGNLTVEGDIRSDMIMTSSLAAFETRMVAPPRTGAPSSPQIGELYMNTETRQLMFYNGERWIGIGGV